MSNQIDYANMTKWNRVAFVLKHDLAPTRIGIRFFKASKAICRRWMDFILELVLLIAQFLATCLKTACIPILPLLDSILSVHFAITATKEEWTTTSRHVLQMKGKNTESLQNDNP